MTDASTNPLTPLQSDMMTSYTFPTENEKPYKAPSVTQHSTEDSSLFADEELLHSERVDNKEQQCGNDNSLLHRHFTLLDLISIGVAATIGSGIFVLCGLIAHDFAGPATFICWGIAGFSSCMSGLCYAELSGKFSVSGSTFSYVQITMGRIPAVVAGACLTIEYVGSASAVARAWGDKVVRFISHIDGDMEDTSMQNMILKIIDPGYGINPMAFVVSAASVTLLLVGVHESKRVTNIFTVLKVSLVLLMSVASLSLFNVDNLFPLLPAKFGVAGIFRGSTSAFFGYIGFDEICCMAGEAVEPSKNLPRAVMGSITLVTVLYVIAAIGLTGMVPYEDISVTSGFPDGFSYRGHDILAQVTAVGELISLPIVVMVTMMAQPRLQHAMALDGILPAIFSHVDESGNLWYGTFVAGMIMVTISTFVPFTYLNDIVSAGVLMAFSMSGASVVLLRHKSPPANPFLLEKLLSLFNVLSLSMSLLMNLEEVFGENITYLLSLINFLMLLTLAMRIGSECPKVRSNGRYFETPFVPYLPLLSQFLNWYLIGQLEMFSLVLLFGYVSTAALLDYVTPNFSRNKI
mmetsp:Transcript_21433/g.24357  ORF Transcript_21433/g.24357 Transcript_21433/m.24357 type:complete len:576 (-) Transcript_21433:192-1919(-)